MLVFIDDGSTNIKLQWQENDGTIKQHISPNSFKREWAVSFGDKKIFNYTLNGEQYSFDPISPDAVVTTNIAWQYSDVNVVAVHHALLTSGLPVSEVDIVCTLPLTEYYDRNNQPNTENIERKKANFRKKITLNGGDTFTIKDVKVMPESIPAGYEVLQELDELDSLLIITLFGLFFISSPKPRLISSIKAFFFILVDSLSNKIPFFSASISLRISISLKLFISHVFSIIMIKL